MTYFRPWRRKVGVLLLLCAANLAVIWIRSLITRDAINFFVGSDPVWIVSELGAIRWAKVLETDFRNAGQFYTWDVDHFPTPSWFSERSLPEDQRIRWHWLGFASFADQNQSQVWIISYLAVIYLLILVSVFLLLSRPRAGQQMDQDRAARLCP